MKFANLAAKLEAKAGLSCGRCGREHVADADAIDGYKGTGRMPCTCACCAASWTEWFGRSHPEALEEGGLSQSDLDGLYDRHQELIRRRQAEDAEREARHKGDAEARQASIEARRGGQAQADSASTRDRIAVLARHLAPTILDDEIDTLIAAAKEGAPVASPFSEDAELNDLLAKVAASERELPERDNAAQLAQEVSPMGDTNGPAAVPTGSTEDHDAEPEPHQPVAKVAGAHHGTSMRYAADNRDRDAAPTEPAPECVDLGDGDAVREWLRPRPDPPHMRPGARNPDGTPGWYR